MVGLVYKQFCTLKIYSCFKTKQFYNAQANNPCENECFENEHGINELIDVVVLILLAVWVTVVLTKIS